MILQAPHTAADRQRLQVLINACSDFDDPGQRALQATLRSGVPKKKWLLGEVCCNLWDRLHGMIGFKRVNLMNRLYILMKHTYHP